MKKYLFTLVFLSSIAAQAATKAKPESIVGPQVLAALNEVAHAEVAHAPLALDFTSGDGLGKRSSWDEGSRKAAPSDLDRQSSVHFEDETRIAAVSRPAVRN